MDGLTGKNPYNEEGGDKRVNRSMGDTNMRSRENVLMEGHDAET